MKLVVEFFIQEQTIVLIDEDESQILEMTEQEDKLAER
jgi:hypothetical protein